MKYSKLFILIVLLISHTIFAQQMPPMPAPAVPPMGVGPGPGAGIGVPGLPPELMMSEQEFNEMMQFLSTLDEKELQELERLGREALKEMGIDPDTLEPIPGAQPPTLAEPAAPPSLEPMPELPPRPMLSAETREELAHLLTHLIEQLSILRHKAGIENSCGLRSWIQELDGLIYYLRVINVPRHHERLLEKEYKNLLIGLQELDAAITREEDFMAAAARPVIMEDDPYEILGVSSRATLEEIEMAYEALAAQKRPEAVRRQRQAEGLTGKDLERAVKEARLSFDIIEDAYEKLSDPKVRAQVDRECSAALEHVLENEQGVHASMARVLQAFSDAIYSRRLLDEIEKFLKKYAPEELAQKKAMELAEKQRLQEQAEAAKRRPMTSPGGPYERPGRIDKSFGNLPSNYFPPLDVGRTPSPTVTPGLPRDLAEKKAEDKKADAKKPEKKDEKKEKEEAEKKKKEEAKLVSEYNDVKKLFDKVAKHFGKIQKVMQVEANHNLLESLPEYLFPSGVKKRRVPIHKRAPKKGPGAVEETEQKIEETTGSPAEEEAEEAEIEEIGEAPAEAPGETPKVVDESLNVKLEALAKQLDLPALLKDLKSIRTKISKMRDDRLKGSTKEAWNKLWKAYGEVPKAFATRLSYKRDDQRMPEEKVRAHIGTVDEPKILATFYEQVEKVRETMEKINKVMNPEQYKKDDKSAPKPEESSSADNA